MSEIRGSKHKNLNDTVTYKKKTSNVEILKTHRNSKNVVDEQIVRGV